MKLVTNFILCVNLVLISVGSALSQYTLEQTLGAPYAQSIHPSVDGKALAWVINEKGVRNIWYTDVTNIDAQKMTNYDQDDGQNLSEVVISNGYMLFVKGNDNNRNGEPITADESHFSQDLEYVFELFPILKERHRQRGGTLSGGEQQMLAIARALMSRPRLLLLDEPSLGLAPLVVQRIFEVIGEINAERDMTIFLVEQNAYHALRLADRGYVMANGQIQMEGSGAELLSNADIRSAYLGGDQG